MESGTVKKGDLIGYLGDSDENGGTADNPLRPHLHFGIRSGQRKDYPGQGEWRWQAGWIRLCPQDVGWLNPSEFITDQDVPPGGFLVPDGDFLSKWGVVIFLASVYLMGAGCMVLYAVRKNKVLLPGLYGIIMIVVGLIFLNKGTRLAYILFPLAALMVGCSIYLFIRSRNI